MNELDKKILDNFPGKVVRKDLTILNKKGLNVPTYVLEYLLGMYCATDDEDAIKVGLAKIRQILSENYVRADMSEYIKLKIKQNGQYTIIDKITVRFEDSEDKYVASFSNLNIDDFEVSEDIVSNNEKLLIGGIWCIVNIQYQGLDHKDQDDLDQSFLVETDGNTQKKKAKVRKKKSRFDSPFVIASLKPIQMPNLDLQEFIDARANFTKEEWIDLLLRSAGYEPTPLSEKEKLDFLLRFVPLIQQNYNLVELGPRGTGKSHVYSELSPYSILMSSGTTSVANMFYNMASHSVGLVGKWDCIAFDEVSGISSASGDMIQIMKNYMANGSFARGVDTITSDASIAFEGNIFRSVADMMRTTNLFEPFPEEFNNDSAFFDRIHAYLPGWEIPKLKSSSMTNSYGLISDCFAEFCHLMRRRDFTGLFDDYFSLNKNFHQRDDLSVRKTFSGLAKLIYPDQKISKEEARELLAYAIEARRRVKEQLRKMNPSEYSRVNMGYIDKETGEETIINLPEVASGTLVSSEVLEPGFVYGVGKSVSDKIGIYRLENKLIDGTGKLQFKDIEGIANNKEIRDSLNAAFNYFEENAFHIIAGSTKTFNYSLYFNDLQNRGSSNEVSVAEAVSFFSAFSGKPVLPSLVICGRVVMSGSMMPVTTDLDDIFVTVSNAGAKNLMLPDDTKDKYEKLKDVFKGEINVIFYSTPLDAAKKALKLE